MSRICSEEDVHYARCGQGQSISRAEPARESGACRPLSVLGLAKCEQEHHCGATETHGHRRGSSLGLKLGLGYRKASSSRGCTSECISEELARAFKSG